MPWFKIDDGFHCHPKIMAAGNAALGLWTRLGAYCSDQLTDGFVPESIAKTYGKRGEIDRLLAVNLLENGEHSDYGPGYWLHDYLDYNPTAEHVRAQREMVADRQRRARQRREAQRDSDDPSNADVTRDVTRESRVTAGSVSHAAPTRPDPTRPVSTSRSTDTSPARTVKRPVDNPTPIGEFARRAIGKGGR